MVRFGQESGLTVYFWFYEPIKERKFIYMANHSNGGQKKLGKETTE
jgi:hypothetical protein